MQKHEAIYETRSKLSLCTLFSLRSSLTRTTAKIDHLSWFFTLVACQAVTSPFATLTNKIETPFRMKKIWCLLSEALEWAKFKTLIQLHVHKIRQFYASQVIFSDTTFTRKDVLSNQFLSKNDRLESSLPWRSWKKINFSLQLSCSWSLFLVLLHFPLQRTTPELLMILLVYCRFFLFMKLQIKTKDVWLTALVDYQPRARLE